MAVNLLTSDLKLMTLVLLFGLSNARDFNYFKEAIMWMSLKEFSMVYKNETYQIVEDEISRQIQPILRKAKLEDCVFIPCEHPVFSKLTIQELKESTSFVNLKYILIKIKFLITWQDNRLFPKGLKLSRKYTMYAP